MQNDRTKNSGQKQRKGDTSRTSNRGQKLSSGGIKESDNRGRPKEEIEQGRGEKTKKPGRE